MRGLLRLFGLCPRVAYLLICGFAYLRICLFAYLPICGFAYLPICESAYQRICESAYLRICESAHLPICEFANLRNCVSTYLKIKTQTDNNKDNEDKITEVFGPTADECILVLLGST